MSDVRPYLWLIPALPLAGRRRHRRRSGRALLREHSHWPCILAGAGASSSPS